MANLIMNIIMYTLIGVWVFFILWRILHYVVILPKKVKPTKEDVKKALTLRPQHMGEIQIKILEHKKYLPRKRNIFGFYDKTFPIMDFLIMSDHLKTLIIEGVASKKLVEVSPERAKRIGKPTEEVFMLKEAQLQ